MDKETVLSINDIIDRRRSIRSYKADPPPDEWIAMMVRCASRAPSPSNVQPVRFLRIVSKEIRDELHEAMISGREKFLKAAGDVDGSKRLKNIINTYYRYSEWMFTAPLIFAVGVLKSASGFSKRLFEAGLLTAYEPKDLDISLGLAIKGFILKAEELRLGTCILTAPLVFISRTEEILGVDDLYIRCFVTVGFPNETPAPVERKGVKEIYKKI